MYQRTGTFFSRSGRRIDWLCHNYEAKWTGRDVSE